MFGAVGGILKAATDGVGDLLNDCGIGDQSRPGGGNGEGNWTAEWMKRYSPALQDLKLADMSIPGTHDSGTAKMVRTEFFRAGYDDEWRPIVLGLVLVGGRYLVG